MNPILEAVHNCRIEILKATGKDLVSMYFSEPEVRVIIEGVAVYMSASQAGYIILSAPPGSIRHSISSISTEDT